MTCLLFCNDIMMSPHTFSGPRAGAVPQYIPPNVCRNNQGDFRGGVVKCAVEALVI